MKAHDLAQYLLKCQNLEVTASIDISTNEEDSDRRIFTTDCFGVNNIRGDDGVITVLFEAKPEDNYGNVL
jgi:hypothetical protein